MAHSCDEAIDLTDIPEITEEQLSRAVLRLGGKPIPKEKVVVEGLISPRLQQLLQAIEEGDSAALDAFWQQTAAAGAPLIEPDKENSNYSLVTFLWRGAQTTKSVAVQVAVDGSGQDEHSLSRLPDTNLWYATFRLRNDYRGAYKFLVDESGDAEDAVEKPDPFNPHTFIEPKDAERPDHSEDDIDSLIRLSAAPNPTWSLLDSEVAKGQVERYLFRSQMLGNERRVWVYSPPQDVSSGDLNRLLVILDGRFFTFAIRTPTILDNLLASGHIPPYTAVFVDNPGDTWEASMQTREKELACNPRFAQSLADELMPWLRHTLHIAADPEKTILVGGSQGGLAAAFTALQHPQTFGNVIALSGSFWWRPPGETEWEWLTRQFAKRPLAPLQLYIEVGLLESAPTATGFPGQLLSNRHLRTVLQAKGYKVHYDEQMHGHDSMAWQGALAEGLMALTRDV